jgi:hypothetical protein
VSNANRYRTARCSCWSGDNERRTWERICTAQHILRLHSSGSDDRSKPVKGRDLEKGVSRETSQTYIFFIYRYSLFGSVSFGCHLYVSKNGSPKCSKIALAPYKSAQSRDGQIGILDAASKSTKRIESRSHHQRKSSHIRRKPWVLNPFRLQDEEQMLAKRTHNRRRWSHVFPPGEIEFKRQSGPNWKSLCQPAVLPLTTDFHPEEYELNDPTKYEFNHYNIFTDAVDLSYYKSLDDLLMEMVIQRIIQDYQIVPDAVVRESQNRSEARRKGMLQ